MEKTEPDFLQWCLVKGHKLTYRKFYFNIRKNFFTGRAVKQQKRLPRKDVASPLLKIFKTRLDVVQSRLFYLTLL